MKYISKKHNLRKTFHFLDNGFTVSVSTKMLVHLTDELRQNSASASRLAALTTRTRLSEAAALDNDEDDLDDDLEEEEEEHRNDAHQQLAVSGPAIDRREQRRQLRLTSALTASHAVSGGSGSAGALRRGGGSNACWRSVVRRDPFLLQYGRPEHRITASEMCSLSHQAGEVGGCKICTAKTRTTTGPRIPASMPSANATVIIASITAGSSQNFSDPFHRLTAARRIDQQQSQKQRQQNSSENQQLNASSAGSDFFFVNLKQLESKLHTGFRNPFDSILLRHHDNYAIAGDRHSAVVSRYQRVSHIRLVTPTSDVIKVSPPLLPLFRQTQTNSFFIH